MGNFVNAYEVGDFSILCHSKSMAVDTVGVVDCPMSHEGISENMERPRTTAQWKIDFSKGLDGLQLVRDEPIPDVGPNDCLVQFEAVSLNYRDIAMPLGLYPAPASNNIVPTSDGAGLVLQVGSKVKEFKAGDKVCNTFFLDYEDGPISAEVRKTNLGALNDGPLRKYAVWPAKALVRGPSHLDAKQCSTLPCAALTAWNTLFGLEGRQLRSGQTILTQGTGGVSLFAIQFALAIGATVIATTSSDSKADKLRSMGVQHVVNYKTDQSWGETAKALSTDSKGVQHIVEVGGEATMAQSFKAIAPEGVISIIGFLAPKDGDARKTSFWDAFATASIIRGITVGSRAQFKEMNRFIEKHGIQPVVDEQVFGFEQAKDAFKYLQAQKFFGKVVIDLTDG